MSESNKFQRALGEKLSERLEGFKFYKTNLELRRKTQNGFDVVILGGSNKWAPSISISFHYGKRFNAVREIETKLNEQPMFYHIHHYSPNSKGIEGLEYDGADTWKVDIREDNENLIDDIAKAIEGIAFPFFERFSELQAAREALASGDSWCIGAQGSFWPSLFKMDAALDDLAHFKEWSNSLTPFHKKQALKKLEEYESDFNIKI